MKIHRVMVALASMLVLPSIAATQDSEYERFLVPVYRPTSIEGALGSRWATELWIRNGNDHDVQIWGFGACGNIECSLTHYMRPKETSIASPVYSPCHGNMGVLLGVPREAAKQIQFGLRVHEISVEAFRGVEMPVVREGDLHEAKVHLLGIPIDPLYRNLLRIYLVRPAMLAHEYRWRVEVVAADDGAVLSEAEVGASAESYVKLFTDGELYETFYCAGEASLASVFEAASRAAPIQTVHVEITPLFDDGSAFWAFVSSTSNQTHEVTLFTPQ